MTTWTCCLEKGHATAMVKINQEDPLQHHHPFDRREAGTVSSHSASHNPAICLESSRHPACGRARPNTLIQASISCDSRQPHTEFLLQRTYLWSSEWKPHRLELSHNHATVNPRCPVAPSRTNDMVKKLKKYIYINDIRINRSNRSNCMCDNSVLNLRPSPRVAEELELSLRENPLYRKQEKQISTPEMFDKYVKIFDVL